MCATRLHSSPFVMDTTPFASPPPVDRPPSDGGAISIWADPFVDRQTHVKQEHISVKYKPPACLTVWATQNGKDVDFSL